MEQLYWNVSGKVIDPQMRPGRIAYIDECGNFGFDFSKEGTSKFYIICAIIVNQDKKDALESQVEVIRQTIFGPREMKSNEIGDNVNRRKKLITELLPLDFNIIALIADKQKFYEDTPLTNFKDTFIKFLHDKLYQNLYSAYPKLKIAFDKTGYSEFQNGFLAHVKKHRPSFNLFDEYDFDFFDSKEVRLIQVADIIAGTLNRYYLYPKEVNYQGILKSKILNILFFPEKFENYLTKVQIGSNKVNKDIYEMSYRSIQKFLEDNKGQEDEAIRLQVEFLKYLLFQCRNMSPNRFIPSREILNVLNEYRAKKVTKDYFYRRIIAPIRDAGVILSSSSQGYKIPICEDDIEAYINQTSTVVAPMLHRLGICRDTIYRQTDGKLDVLDKQEFIKYKNYFG